MFQAILLALAWQPQVDIYRDKWGVPSIVASDIDQAMYGLGYMHVVDDGERMALNYKIARGRAAEVLGNSQLLQDGFLRGLEIEEHADAAKLSPRAESLVASYLAGANKALAERKAKLPGWIEPFTRTDVLSMSQFVNSAFPLLDLARQIMPGVGSNQFAVAAKKTATGGPILSMDPHLEWNGADGGILWYEAGIYAPGIKFRGVSIPGLPGCMMGHNDKFGWSITNNNPQVYTRYTVVKNQADASQYSYHGEWKPFRTKQIVLKYRAGDQMKEQKQTLKLTEWGPMVPLRNESAIVEPIGNFAALEQLVPMMQSQNGSDFRKAMSMHGLSMWNFVYAGKDGTIGYQYNASMATRDASIDWSKPVPGNDPKTRLGPMWTLDALPHVENPSSGMLVNCNSSPNLVPYTSELPGKWPAYVTTYGLTSRYRMLGELVKAQDHITPEMAMKDATDTRVPFAGAAVKALAAKMPDDPFVKALASWNGRADIDSRGTAAYAYWLTSSPAIANLVVSVAHGKPWTADELATALAAVEKAKAQMTADRLAFDVRWGEVLRMRRGSKEIGVEGFDGVTNNGSVAVNPSGSASGLGKMMPRILAGRGSSFRMVVSFEPGGVRSWSILPYGNSHDPASPYYANQMDFYAVGRYKPTEFGVAAAKAGTVEHLVLGG
ncbi:acylase [soil metagenome]